MLVLEFRKSFALSLLVSSDLFGDLSVALIQKNMAWYITWDFSLGNCIFPYSCLFRLAPQRVLDTLWLGTIIENLSVVQPALKGSVAFSYALCRGSFVKSV